MAQPNFGILANALVATSQQLALIPNVPAVSESQAILASLAEIRNDLRGLREEVRDEVRVVREEVRVVREEVRGVREEVRVVRQEVRGIQTRLNAR